MPESPPSRRPWVCLWADVLDSRKLARAGEAADWLYTRLLALCGERGVGDTIQEASAEDLGWRLRREPADIEARLAALTVVGLIERTGDSVRIVGWHKRQPERTDAERNRDYRDRKRRERAGGERAASGRVVEDRAGGERPAERKTSALDSDSDSDSDSYKEKSAAVVEPPPDPLPADISLPASRVTGSKLDPKGVFQAICRGLGLQLSWSANYVFSVDKVIRWNPADMAEIEAVAKHHAKGITPPARVSFAPFCSAYDQRRGEWRAAKKPAASSKKWCPTHPGTALTRDGCGVCNQNRHTEESPCQP